VSRSGDWIATISGRRWFITDPDAEDVHIRDIAHGLSMTCRFGGHCREFYSVAQHSVHVADVIRQDRGDDTHMELWGLMHDATEAYVGDMVRPLKLSMPAYKVIEERTERAICAAFGIIVPPDIRHWVKRYDDVLLMTERRDLMNHCGYEWTPKVNPWDHQIFPLDIDEARSLFLVRFFELTRKMGIATPAMDLAAP
jgi:hypothetical protein